MTHTLVLILLTTLFVGCEKANEDKNPFVKKFQGLHGSPTEYKEAVHKASEKFDEVLIEELESSKVIRFAKDGTFSAEKEFNENEELISSIELENYDGGSYKQTYKYYEYQDGNATLTKHSEDEYMYENGENKYILIKDKISNTNTKIDCIVDSPEKTHSQVIGEDGRKHETICYKDYKKRERIIKFITDGDEDKIEEYYDANWNLIEVKKDDPNGHNWIKYKYNEKDLVVEEKQLWKYGNLITYKYPKFDDKGNWIEKVEYEDGEIKNVYIREITY